MRRALREFRIRGVKTNIPFLDQAHQLSPTFMGGTVHHAASSMKRPELFDFKPAPGPRNKTADLPRPKRHRQRQRAEVKAPLNFGQRVYAHRSHSPEFELGQLKSGTRPAQTSEAPGTRSQRKFCANGFSTSSACLMFTDTTFRDAHQSLLGNAASVRTTCCTVADAVRRGSPRELFSTRDVGRCNLRRRQ